MSAPMNRSVQAESPYTQALAEIAGERWKHYQKVMKPVENQYMGNVKWMGSDQAKNIAQGEAASEAMGQAAPQIQQQESTMMANGVNPNTGSFVMKRGASANAEGDMLARGMTDANLGQRKEYLSGLQNIVNMGNGEATQSTQSLGDVANMGLNAAENNAEWNAQANQAVGGAFGTAAGLGLGSYKTKEA
jgi:hypothetical protein